MWQAIAAVLALIIFGLAASYYFIWVQVGSAPSSDVAKLAFAFMFMFGSIAFLMEIGRMNLWGTSDSADSK
jgi:hypothetical protein